MENYQNENVSKKLYRSEYELKDGQKLVLRTPQLGDEQGLIDQMKLVDSETRFLAREADEFNFTVEQEREFIKNAMNSEDSLFLVGEVDGKIIANCSVGLVLNKRRFRHRASMGVVVSKAYWNKGVGKRMMQECIKWCQEKSVEQLELEVLAENSRAVAMYENFGFQTYGTIKNALKYADGTYGDEYFMVLFLKDKNPA